MQIEQKKFSGTSRWEPLRNSHFTASRNYEMVFGSPSIFDDSGIYVWVRDQYPNANIIMNSTASGSMKCELHNQTMTILTLSE